MSFLIILLCGTSARMLLVGDCCVTSSFRIHHSWDGDTVSLNKLASFKLHCYWKTLASPPPSLYVWKGILQCKHQLLSHFISSYFHELSGQHCKTKDNKNCIFYCEFLIILLCGPSGQTAVLGWLLFDFITSLNKLASFKIICYWKTLTCLP
jgi:hypothetical protein